jgi:hypothetical protein
MAVPAQTLDERVDRTALRFNQASIIFFVLLSFLLNQPWLVGFVGAVMALGTLTPSFALFHRIYRDVLRPAGLLKPDVHPEASAPHRFAQGLGAAFLILALAALLTGLTAVGWALALIVVVLAAINLFFGFCAGCFIFFQLERLRKSSQ